MVGLDLRKSMNFYYFSSKFILDKFFEVCLGNSKPLMPVAKSRNSLYLISHINIAK